VPQPQPVKQICLEWSLETFTVGKELQTHKHGNDSSNIPQAKSTGLLQRPAADLRCSAFNKWTGWTLAMAVPWRQHFKMSCSSQ